MASMTDIISKLGGPELVASKLNISLKAIDMWRRRGGIPPARHLDLLLLAKERRVRLSLDELSTQSQRAA